MTIEASVSEDTTVTDAHEKAPAPLSPISWENDWKRDATTKYDSRKEGNINGELYHNLVLILLIRSKALEVRKGPVSGDTCNGRCWKRGGGGVVSIDGCGNRAWGRGTFSPTATGTTSSRGAPKLTPPMAPAQRTGRTPLLIQVSFLSLRELLPNKKLQNKQ
jgi:hypothetical protein